MLSALVLSLLAAAQPAASGTLVVLNKAEATASLIDLATGAVAATLPTGEGPHEAAVSPDGRLALAANYGTGQAPGSTLTLIDVAAARVVKTISLGEYKRPHGVQWLADGKRAAVTCEASKALVVVDVEAGKVAGAVTTGQDVSHMVAVAPDGSRAYVASIGSGTLTVVDMAGRKVVQVVPTGKGAEGIDITPDGREVWVTNREADTVSVVDTGTLQVVATLPAKTFPIRVKITPDGKQALVSCARTGDVAVFDVAGKLKETRRVAMKLDPASSDGRIFQDFGTSPVPIGIVVRPDGKQAWIANANADAVAVLDLETWKVIGTLKAGKEPDGMAYSALAVTK
jgi:YVTN family beta-propeller protein